MLETQIELHKGASPIVRDIVSGPLSVMGHNNVGLLV